MSIVSEFKEFAMKGNVVDLTVGVIIGGAFGKITTSLVDDVIMPPIGLAIGGMDFTALAITLKPATDGAEAVVIKYGMFAQTLVDFLIVAFVIFMLIKVMNKLKKPAEAAPEAPAATPREEVLLEQILETLKAKG